MFVVVVVVVVVVFLGGGFVHYTLILIPFFLYMRGLRIIMNNGLEECTAYCSTWEHQRYTLLQIYISS